MISITSGVSASIVTLAIGFILICKKRISMKRARRENIHPYAINIFGSMTRERMVSESALIRDATTGERIYESIEEISTGERIYESIDDLTTKNWREKTLEIMQEMKTSQESSTSTTSSEVV